MTTFEDFLMKNSDFRSVDKNPQFYNFTRKISGCYVYSISRSFALKCCNFSPFISSFFSSSQTECSWSSQLIQKMCLI